jgi:mono/diheme cytochrome c family protein
MIRAAGAAARVTAGVAATLVAVCAHAATPAQDYVLNCMGCHGTEAQGIPGKVPPLANALSRFMRSPEGRNYVLRVPGAASSALSDEQLAAVLNWLAVTYDSSATANQPAPFTSTEVAAVRHQPLLSVLATRSAVVQNLSTTGPSPPPQY